MKPLISKLLLLLAFCFTSLLPIYGADDVPPNSLFKNGNFEKGWETHDPWQGVNGINQLKVKPLTDKERAITIDSLGKINFSTKFPPSAAIADLNGDGLLDLIVSNSQGYIFFYKNQGTPKEPQFGFADIIPLWIQEKPPGLKFDDVGLMPSLVNKVNVADFNDDGKLDIVYGDYFGQMFFIPNEGTVTQPKFPQPKDQKKYEVSTSSKNRLWSNYLSPVITDWDEDGLSDLIIGVGSYSANNIYFLKNIGSNEEPRFEKREILLSGQGKEHLTPQVLDWNDDGKMDVVTGEREGNLTAYINTTENQEEGPYTFKKPKTVFVGPSSKIGLFSRPAFGDLNGDGLIDIVFGQTDGTLAISYNKGTKKAPKLDTHKTISSVESFKKIMGPNDWDFIEPAEKDNQAQSCRPVPVLLTLASTKEDDYGYDPELKVRPGSQGHRVLKFDQNPLKNSFFPGKWKLDPVNLYKVEHRDSVKLKSGTTYSLSFYCKGSGFKKAIMSFNARDKVLEKNNEGIEELHYVNYKIPPDQEQTFKVPSSWGHIRKTFKFKKTRGDKNKPVDFWFNIELFGQGTFYLDDISVVPR